MEAQITGEPWDGNLFGMNVGGWMGMEQKSKVGQYKGPTDPPKQKDIGFGKPFFDSAASAPPAQVPDTTITPTYPPGYINPLTLLPYTVGYVPVR